jgi:hypothetical protein
MDTYMLVFVLVWFLQVVGQRASFKVTNDRQLAALAGTGNSLGQIEGIRLHFDHFVHCISVWSRDEICSRAILHFYGFPKPEQARIVFQVKIARNARAWL